MKYAVKEVFYTLQGEGFHAGRAAVFVRFAGCNLWNGLESGRASGKGGCARWCDTDFVGTSGNSGGMYDCAELTDVACRAWPETAGGEPMVVLTGGEPTLQVDDALVSSLKAAGFYVAMESNGTCLAPRGLDWLCISPKVGGLLAQLEADEIKVVFPQKGINPETYESMGFGRLSIQPKDDSNLHENMALAVEFCLRHPRWRLSIQAHKLAGIR